MLVYGVAVLAGCYLAGQLIGEVLGRVLHIDANVGGVGFAMLLLVLVHHWVNKKNGLQRKWMMVYYSGVNCTFLLLLPCQLRKMW